MRGIFKLYAPYSVLFPKDLLVSRPGQQEDEMLGSFPTLSTSGVLSGSRKLAPHHPGQVSFWADTSTWFASIFLELLLPSYMEPSCPNKFCRT